MTDPITGLPVEAIRFGSTTESARGITTWLRETYPAATLRLEFQPDTTKLLIFGAGGDFILSHGDYLVMEDGLAKHYTSDAFIEKFGDASAQPLEGEAGGLDTPVAQ